MCMFQPIFNNEQTFLNHVQEQNQNQNQEHMQHKFSHQFSCNIFNFMYVPFLNAEKQKQKQQQ